MNVNRSLRFYFVFSLIILTICAISFFYNCVSSNVSLKRFESTTLLQSEAESIYQRVRIHCLINYSYTNAHWSVLIKRTWARHCNKVLFVSGDSNGELEPYVPQVNATEKWFLMRMGLIYAYTYERNEADWFLHVRDVSFVIVENLRQMLQNYSTDTPIYFGCKLKESNNQPFMSGSAGIVLSKEALRRFVEISVPNSTLCNTGPSKHDDIEMAHCLLNVGVIAGDSRDEFGRHTFVPHPLQSILTGKFLIKIPWFANKTFYDLVNNTLPISKRAITFNEYYPYNFYNYYYFIYKVKHFGLQSRTTSLSSRQNALSGVLSVPPYA